MLDYLTAHAGSCSTCLLDSSHQRTALHVAAQRGHVDTVRYLVNKGADINIQDNKGVSERKYTADCELIHVTG